MYWLLPLSQEESGFVSPLKKVPFLSYFYLAFCLQAEGKTMKRVDINFLLLKKKEKKKIDVLSFSNKEPESIFFMHSWPGEIGRDASHSQVYV